MRYQGRLLNSDLDNEGRKPVILPRQHRFTRLVVEECHWRVHHGGIRPTLAELRSRFWVPRGRQLAKRILGECVTCRKLIGKQFSAPPNAVLPVFRVKEAPPFLRVGVDFAGPLYVKEKPGQISKAYVAIYSCCVTRAVHLELVEDLSAEAFRHCLRKFVARRGMPVLTVLDNAKTFQNEMEIQLRKGTLVGRIFRTNGSQCKGLFEKDTGERMADIRWIVYSSNGNRP